MDQGIAIQSRARPKLKNFSRIQIIKFEKGVERFITDSTNAGLPRNWIALNKKKSTYLTTSQLEFIKEELQKEEAVTEEDIELFFSRLKTEAKPEPKDVKKLLETCKMKYFPDVYQALSSYLLYCRKTLENNNVDLDVFSSKTVLGRKTIFKTLLTTLTPANREIFKSWMSQNASEEGVYYEKDPPYTLCKDKFLSLLKEDFKRLTKLKIGTFIEYDRSKRKRSNANSSTTTKVKKLKKKKDYKCWKCGQNHHMMECPDIPKDKRKSEYLKLLEKKKEEWKEKAKHQDK